ncbi:hypothetical protein C8R44DRAFT_835768 [Mycena epipterygia]|nr:hypothetical protein C8R44DRAFT_836559 [Mycena epipterygia]KAJ7091574.1 hypothetical protein C8R44DRAFT_835768 [Mycena epipterygia]
MHGRFHDGQDKWLHVNQIMRDKRIGILALQETHLSQKDTDNLNSFFERNLAIFSTIDPTSPSGKGVAIVPAENANFLETLQEKMSQLSRPDFVLGDFNMVEEALDRLHHHKDALNVFLQKKSGSQSRIDRIYVPHESLIDLSDWAIEICALPTDHKLVSVNYSNAKIPFISRGRWSLPLHILKDKETMNKIQELGKALEDAMKCCKFCRSESDNPQVLFKKFKDDRAKIMMLAIDKEIIHLKSKLFNLMNNPDEPDEEKNLRWNGVRDDSGCSEITLRDLTHMASGH